MGKSADRFLTVDGWSVIENGFHKEKNAVAESIFSIGNEYCGLRGYMEEGASAPSLQGCYFNGIYEWAEKVTETAYKGIIKRGHYMVNAVNPIATRILVDGEPLDLGKTEPVDFVRKLDFKSGLYTRSFKIKTRNGIVSFEFSRFLSMEHCESLFQKIEISADYPAVLEVYAGLDFATKHWGRAGRWQKVKTKGNCAILGKTSSTNQYLACEQQITTFGNAKVEYTEGELSAGCNITAAGSLTIEKRVVCLTDRTGEKGEKLLDCFPVFKLDYSHALKLNEAYYAKFWASSDIEIRKISRA